MCFPISGQTVSRFLLPAPLPNSALRLCWTSRPPSRIRGRWGRVGRDSPSISGVPLAVIGDAEFASIRILLHPRSVVVHTNSGSIGILAFPRAIGINFDSASIRSRLRPRTIAVHLDTRSTAISLVAGRSLRTAIFIYGSCSSLTSRIFLLPGVTSTRAVSRLRRFIDILIRICTTSCGAFLRRTSSRRFGGCCRIRERGSIHGFTCSITFGG